MKKILSLMIALVAMVTLSANAQTVQPSGLFDNTAVTVKGGVSGLMHPGCNGYQNFGHTLQANAGLGLEKWITPAFGVGLEGEVGFTNGSKTGFYQSKNWVNYLTVMAQAKVNLGNLILGYNGQPRTWEFVPTVGIGWVHGFYQGTEWGYPATGATYCNDQNSLGTKYAVEVKYNVNSWLAVTATPYLAYRLTTQNEVANRQPRFDARNAWYGLDLGLSFRVGKTFKLCPYKYTQKDVDLLNAQINQLRGENDKLRNQEPKVVEKIVEKTMEKTVESKYSVSFAQGSAELTETAKETLDKIPAGKSVSVIGTTSPEGSTDLNNKLSEQRAEVVAKYLQNRGVTVTRATGKSAGRLGIVTVE